MRSSAHHFIWIFAFVLLDLAVVSPVTDKEILLQFKGNVSSDPYDSLSSWVSSEDPCGSYKGVFCDSDGNVVRIVLWNTSLSGVLSPALSELKSLRIINLFGNQFRGNIPSEYGEIETLWKINLSSNALSGSIPDFLGGLSNIRFLDLSKNGYTGEIPSALFNNCGKTKFISLSHNIYLSLRNNVLTGTVDQQVSKCQRLVLLDLGSNSFTGSAPFGALGLTNLTYFNISQNGFQGKIPETNACSQRLEFLDASGNQLHGELPVSITNCKGLKLLDLGFNSLNGSILSGFGNIELLQVLDLHNLELVGNIPEDISNCRFLLKLDLSGNELQGEIPETLYNMSYLEILDLHRNRLNGSIPFSLGNLSHIKFFDLSENYLSGSIPVSLGDLKNLTHFNLSYNKLYGTVPSPLQHFGFSAFFHNAGLCGAPLDTPCSGNGTTSSRKPKKFSVSAIIAIVAAALILTGVCVITVVNMKVRRKTREEDETTVLESTPLASSDSNVIVGKLVLFSKSLPSKYEDWEAGHKALLNKECLIGSGSIGTVYRADFEGEISIAVKRLDTLGRIRNQEEFEQEIGRLGNLQHPNLVAYQGYYWSNAMQLILSEFVPNGNLYDNLHGLDFPGTSTSFGNIELNWPRRFKIALGTARALVYLHHDCKPPVLHLNIKSTNILLDENYEAKLSDYGLGKFLPLLDNYGLTKFHNAVGYVAPELAQSLRLSDKYDVYSFGVILLELVTGRKPVESPRGHEVVVLCDYVRGLIESGSASACFDRSLQGFAENELIQVMKLGLICTSEMPSTRPSMAEAVQVLESIRSGLE
ncbi:Non-specific serine/threonine protein kinase [Bertholletia excelsa]